MSTTFQSISEREPVSYGLTKDKDLEDEGTIPKSPTSAHFQHHLICTSGLVLHKLCSLQAQTFRVPKKRTNNNANKYCWLSKNYTRYEFKFCGHACTSVMYYKEMHFAMCLILSFSTLPISFKCLFFVPGDSEFLAKRS